MRIIAGRFRNRRLYSPKGLTVRPTMSQTRESMFHLIESRINLKHADVLDLFAGTGALGLESISRGADSVTFVEKHSGILKYARRNAEELGIIEYCHFIRADAVALLERYSGLPFDIIIADPPYDLKDKERLPDLTLPHLKPDGLFVLEHDRRIDFTNYPELDTSRTYGRTHVSVFIKPVLENE